jgi:hypothetical protein
MATMYFTGDCKWARVYRPDDKYEKYGIDVQLDETQQKEYTGIGLKGKIKDGYVTLSSYPDKKKGGPAVKPTVVDAEGKEFTELIGNGSNVTCKIETYTFDNKWGKGAGHRLVGVKVNKHVKYEGEKAASSPGVEGSPSTSRPKILF